MNRTLLKADALFGIIFLVAVIAIVVLYALQGKMTVPLPAKLDLSPIGVMFGMSDIRWRVLRKAGKHRIKDWDRLRNELRNDSNGLQLAELRGHIREYFSMGYMVKKQLADSTISTKKQAELRQKLNVNANNLLDKTEEIIRYYDWRNTKAPSQGW